MVNSVVWTAEEAKFLKAVLRWQDTPTPAADESRRRLGVLRRQFTDSNNNAQDYQNQQQQGAEKRRPAARAAGEFRVLVIGARGTGKTSILTRFGNNTFRGENQPPDPFYERGCRHPIEIDGAPYIVDALEMPSKHLLSNPMLEQALAITEAAVLVYSVRDPSSLKLVEGIAEFISSFVSSSSSSKPYAVMLVGNKSDSSSPSSSSPDSDSVVIDEDEERKVSWAEGNKTAETIRDRDRDGSGANGQQTTMADCPFLEVSAKTGENVDKIFPQIGREILRLKKLGQQRRELAERLARQQQLVVAQQQHHVQPVRRKLGFWRMLSTPFSRRQTAPAY
ncbi:P-loop containing nucleoside triphosphate hydrolase protein [Echria macrotheca]|uniref:P-loop containing nucleoside triphosphate hydrolase protein n=1 Tax=Echria macrotheca TaxID=438768 RepID=A0AAJ0B6C6_9PEZI|nr:P-loop containing nucleoside triphosphate hydrolase protein [Echria macrotheca]